MKNVIWMIGSNGSGKTTQMRNLVRALNSDKGKKFSIKQKEFDYCYTVFEDMCVLGKIGENQCTGLDNVFSQLKVEGVFRSLDKSMKEDKSIVLIESIMATFNWYKSIMQVFEKTEEEARLIVFHLDFSIHHNLTRIQKRRAKKNGREDWYNIVLEDTTYKNIASKNGNFRALANKIKAENEQVFTLKAEESEKSITSSILRIISEIL